MPEIVTIFMPLRDEGVECWRPVRAENLGNGSYRVIDDMPPDEVWEFAAGTIVRCRVMTLLDGMTPVERLVAVGRVNFDP
jgi:hypothetical protein